MSLDGHETLDAWARLRMVAMGDPSFQLSPDDALRVLAETDGRLNRPLTDEEIAWFSWLGQRLVDATVKCHVHGMDDLFVRCAAELEELIDDLLGLAGLYGVGYVRPPS